MANGPQEGMKKGASYTLAPLDEFPLRVLSKHWLLLEGLEAFFDPYRHATHNFRESVPGPRQPCIRLQSRAFA